ncbi:MULTISPECIES: TetR/AcrR family transcriptional regulator [Rhodococcus]|uniref:TetR/AcrR family transcriptional regulator n=1 Tax=Rhodococcus TaxID=1827 RepID=UPI000EB6E6BE|nr:MULTISPECIES: TetR family transcriptional regulator [Rhodococcus]AXY49934.1 TetR family transcriptional regulator [Rhodococcus ruber]MCZ1074313.1 TetR family transcriptional regulator [Rhodococcus sp. A5(2022)]
MSAAKAATVGTGNGRQAILDSALRNMNERGYHGTSMRDIARDADITVASIYHHFKSKQEILQDIMTRALHDAIAMTRGALLRAGGLPDAQLQALVRAWVMFHTARQLDALVGATELRSLNEAGRRLAVADLDPGAPAGHLRGRLAEYRPPHRIVVSGDMPRTPAGTLVPRVARRARTARRRASAPSCGRGAPAGAP